MKEIVNAVGRRAFIALAGIVFVSVASASTWTGAEDGFWTNANNWAEGTVPGCYRDSSGSQVGTTGGTATFTGTALAGNGVVEINLDGLISIANVTLSGGAALPVYVFGDSSGTQVLALEHLGVFTAADEAAAPAPVLRCRLGICAVGASSASSVYSTVLNNSSDTFHVGEFGVWSTFSSPTLTKGRQRGRRHHQYAAYCVSFQDGRRVLQETYALDGYFRAFLEDQA